MKALARISLVRWLAAVGIAWLIVSCGGGVGTGGTGSFASGPISGFGSIVVDGVDFDEALATINDDGGNGRSRAELHLGTVVEVDAGQIRDGAATASNVRIASSLIGAVESTAVDTLVVNGLTVRFNSGTVFDNRFAGGAAGVTVGSIVEVYGFFESASSEILATRIEPSTATSFKFRATIDSFDASARTFDIGGEHFHYAANVPGADMLADGALVRVIVDSHRDPQGRWNATDLRSAAPQAGNMADVRAHGVISSFTSIALFKVQGFTVNASTATIDNGPLALRQRVEVEGSLVNGVLIASKVTVENENGPDELKMNGEIESIDPVAKVFAFKGHGRDMVSFARSDIVYEGGDVTMLVVGAKVRAFGQLSADGTVLEARRIQFEKK
jgi:Domain of unknown function (DUF5666)